MGPRWLLGGEIMLLIRRLSHSEKFSSSNQYLKDLIFQAKPDLYLDRLPLQVSKSTRVHHFPAEFFRVLPLTSAFVDPKRGTHFIRHGSETRSISQVRWGHDFPTCPHGPYGLLKWAPKNHPKLACHSLSWCHVAGRQVVICFSGLQFSETQVELPFVSSSAISMAYCKIPHLFSSTILSQLETSIWIGNFPAMYILSYSDHVPINCWLCHCLGVSINEGTSKWMVYKGKSHLEMDDLGALLFQETSICDGEIPMFWHVSPLFSLRLGFIKARGSTRP